MIKKVFGDAVVFEMPDLSKEHMTKGGIVLPDGQMPSKTITVEALEVGNGKKVADISKGDKLLVSFGRGYPIKLDDGKTYIFINHEDILAKVVE